MNSNAISAKGFFSLVFTGRVISAAMYVVSTETTFSDTDLILRPFLGAVLLLITALPVKWYIRQFKTEGIIEKGSAISPAFGKAIALFYWIMSLYIAIRTAARFDLFATSVMFPEMDMTLFILILLFASAYIATLGIRALGRSAMIFTGVFIGITGLIIISVVSEVDFLNLTPIFSEGYGTFFKDSLVTCGYAFDLAFIPLLLPRIKGDIRKPFFIWLIGITLFISTVSFFVIATLGDFANTQLFPSFSISSIGKIGVFQRLDSLETSLWICGLVLRMSFLLFICTDTLCSLVSRLSRMTSLGISTAVIAAAAIFISQKATRFSIIVAHDQIAVLYIAFVTVLPLTVIAGKWIKERGRRRGTAC